MNDLFDKRTDKEKIIDWVLSQKYVKTSQVILEAAKRGWPVNRVVRNVQDFAQHNADKIRRISDEDAQFYFHTTEGVWEVIK